VIWVLPGGGQRCTRLGRAELRGLTARMPMHRWACSLVVGRQSLAVAAAALQNCASLLRCSHPPRGLIHSVRVAPG
jgi:hypothetical protein